MSETPGENVVPVMVLVLVPVLTPPPHSTDIMNYILEQVPAPQPGLPRPRFSLYLSSQLQYGLVVVFHRQCVILLGQDLFRPDQSNTETQVLKRSFPFSEDLQSIVGQLAKQKASKKIDMEDHGK